MDIEMDIPAAEELEWLESNALLPDDDDPEDYGFFPPEEEDPLGDQTDPLLLGISTNNLPSGPPLKYPGNKRLRAEGSKESSEAVPHLVLEAELGVKRRALQVEADDAHEDWLRYSPRKEPAALAEPERDSFVADAVPAVEVVEEEKTLSRNAIEIDGDCIAITGPCGNRVYAKLNSGVIGQAQNRGKLIGSKAQTGLLSESFSVLTGKIEQDALAKVLQVSLGSPDHATRSAAPMVNEQLWVEKYAPRSFTELLSYEQTNREVLLWLKQWDSSVFGSQIRSTTDDVLLALRQHSSAVQQRRFSNNKSFFGKDKGANFGNQHTESSESLPPDHRSFKCESESWNRKPLLGRSPEQKVLLLCGPPGLGKTTLAHVAAKHCGYHAVEINASDDRSASAIESKVLDVMQMNSVLSDSIPKCLIIDEIDGALGEGKGAIDVILKMITASSKSSIEKKSTSPEAQSGKLSSKKGQKRSILSRPVICICNDVYAPALRPLRQVAKVHKFVQPTVSRIVNRLKFICKKEGFRTNTTALSALAEYTDCDIRSCLNTLQFLNKKKEAINVLEIGSQVIGRKDISRSTLDVWKEVLQKRKLKDDRKSVNKSSRENTFDLIYSLVSNCGEYELTMDGIHENVLSLSYHDAMMKKTVKCLNTLGVSDLLIQYSYRTQQMAVYAYQPPLVITMRNLIAQVEKPNIEWPKTFQRCRGLLMEKKGLVRAWQNKISPLISRHLSVKSFVEDVASPLLHILSPMTLRPVAMHLLSEREKMDLPQLVDTMVSYSITYTNSTLHPLEKTQYHGAAEATPVLSLDPPISDFVKFKDYQSQHLELSGPMKQVLVHEVDRQRILRQSYNGSASTTDETSSMSPKLLTVNPQIKPLMRTSDVDGSSLIKSVLNPNQNVVSKDPTLTSEGNKSLLSRLNVKASADLSRQSRCYFDRFRKESSTNSKRSGETLQKTSTNERDSRPLLFKYNEGFTNAVKRPVRVRDLLL